MRRCDMAENPRESNGGYGPESPDNGGLNAPTTGVGPGRDLTLRLDVDVSDALTGLKALSGRVAKANEMLAVQGASGNWNYDPYMHGLYNGMEFAIALVEGREPAFRSSPDEWLRDRAEDFEFRPEVSE
ncbi:hypothetical protein [Brevibacillus borstelensis]|uniref:hypothetical protein n=1 Tax=Brevibacillus borstelensis TaxID=45462 RepID=UPI00287FC277|nr:hypothetical protein [Brevibacillus borstelensis]WNF07462.1 hypothetical protein RFB14_08690 [Brevibacillus borstelensis]